MSKKNSVTINPKKIKEIIDTQKQLAKKIVIEAREEITKEYLYVISRFYSEYKPIFYYRHFNDDYSETGLINSGLGHTFKKYYKDKKTKFYGGIRISDSYMFNDYSSSKIDVLNSFMNGYHGHKSLGIYSQIETYNHMIKYKNLLKKSLIEKYK